MQLRAGQVAQLADRRRRQVGEITIECRENDLITGNFEPSPAFLTVEQLFRDFEEAVNAQALSVVDELDTAIAALGLHLRSPDGSQRINIHDVQIWSDGGISCRLSRRTAASVGTKAESVSQVPLAAKRFI